MKLTAPGWMCVSLVLAITASVGQGQTPLGSAITYQGRLDQSGSPANGSFPMIFRLWDAATAGNQVGPTLTFDGVGSNPPLANVTDGRFSVALDFGATAYDGNARWLGITVNGTTLTPRQELTAAPHARFSAAPWAPNGSNISNVNTGSVGIGTAAPAARLHVLGGPIANQVRVESSNTVGTWLNLVNTDTDGRRWCLISTGSANGEGSGKLLIRDQTALYNRIVLDPVGNVGIGTSSPLNILHIAHGAVGTGGTTNWGVRIENSTQATYRTGMRISDDGFFDISNRIGGPAFARLNSNGVWTVVSDRRLKRDITSASGNLDKALHLRPVNFRWCEEGSGSDSQLGLIAQEVRDVVPEMVEGREGTGVLTVNYSGLSVVAIGALQELKREKDAEIEEVRHMHAAEIGELRSANRQLAERVATLEALVEKLIAK